MTRLVWAIVLALGLSTPAMAQQDEITGVISAQIEAFQRDDFATAFDFASPSIKGIFGTPERFGSMVRQGYPMVWRPADVRFLGQRPEGGFTYQRVLIRDQAGDYFTLKYQMIAAANGWQINGVRFVEPEAAAA